MSASSRERGMTFACAGETLVGVVSLPGVSVSDVGVVVVVGGPQYRGGSHRQFVQLARALAHAGFPTLRFDIRGMGDSSGEALPHFEATQADIGAAIEALCEHRPEVRRVVLWGLCDGASAALLYVQATRDRRVAGLCLANPWVRSAASQARANVKHYYRDRLRQPEFWRKLFSGKVGAEAWRAFWRNRRAARASPDSAGGGSFQQRMLAGWLLHDGPKLLLLSGADYTAREFDEYVLASPEWTTAVKCASVQRVDLPGADHTFSGDQHRVRAETETAAWIIRLAGACGPPAGIDCRTEVSET